MARCNEGKIYQSRAFGLHVAEQATGNVVYVAQGTHHHAKWYTDPSMTTLTVICENHSAPGCSFYADNQSAVFSPST